MNIPNEIIEPLVVEELKDYYTICDSKKTKKAIKRVLREYMFYFDWVEWKESVK